MTQMRAKQQPDILIYVGGVGGRVAVQRKVKDRVVDDVTA